MNKNEFEYNGKTYIAVENANPCDPCGDCAFCETYCQTLQTFGKIPPCDWAARNENKNVHFVEKGDRTK